MMNKSKSVIGALLLSGVCGVLGASAHDSYHAEMFKLLPGAAKVTTIDAHTYEISDKSGKVLGKVLLDATKKADKPIGFGGPIEVMVAVDPQDKVLGVMVGENEETPRFLRKVKRSGFLQKWNGVSVKDAGAKDVETVSGATRSSSAIKAGVQAISRRFSQAPASQSSQHVQKDMQGMKDMGKQRQFLVQGIAFCDQMAEQWKTKTADEVEVRFIYAVEGKEAGDKAAKAKNLRIFKHGKMVCPKVKALADAYKKDPSEANKQALKKLLEDKLAHLKVAMQEHKQEMQKSLKAMDASMKRNCPLAARRGFMKFSSPEAKKLEAKIQALGAQYRKAPNADNEKALRAALKEQLDNGLAGMGKFVQKKEQELKALKAKYDEIKANPQKSIDARFKELTAKDACGSCKKGATCTKKAGKKCANCQRAKSCKK